ncbi:uncharacterized protein METZ01_LOCUS319586, partial [marine metagenome]
FKIKTVEGPDDFAMMREMLQRRFNHMAKEDNNSPDSETKESWGNIPDLVLIDGGKGHLSAVHEVFVEMGISTDQVPLASLAKQEEEVFVPHSLDPMILPRNSHGLFLVQRIRDEAHRFAITYHQKLRSKRQTQSRLDTVSGIGPKRRKLLIRRFGSVQAIREASMEELSTVPGMTIVLAQHIKEQLEGY